LPWQQSEHTEHEAWHAQQDARRILHAANATHAKANEEVEELEAAFDIAQARVHETAAKVSTSVEQLAVAQEAYKKFTLSGYSDEHDAQVPISAAHIQGCDVDMEDDDPELEEIHKDTEMQQKSMEDSRERLQLKLQQHDDRQKLAANGAHLPTQPTEAEVLAVAFARAKDVVAKVESALATKSEG
jgi:hypothetical protein